MTAPIELRRAIVGAHLCTRCQRRMTCRKAVGKYVCRRCQESPAFQIEYPWWKPYRASVSDY